MDSFLVYCSICCCLVLSTDGVILTLEMKSILPLKGSSLELSCRISEPFNSNLIVIWKGASQVTLCYGDSYLCDFYKNGYSFTTNSTGVYGSISSLTTEAEGTWRCSYRRTSGADIDSNTWNLIVYTIPPGLSITQDPNQNVDLSVNSVALQCKTTGCTHPIPTVQWIFQDKTTSSENVYATNTNNPTGIQEMCVTQEKIYTSTLNLKLYTTLNDNTDKNVTFSCRIEYPDSSRNIIAYASNTVRFAVRVTESLLQLNNQNITETLNVTSAEPVSLTCVTGTSRPTPTIDWYIGSHKKGDGPIVTFAFSNMDHEEMIYCQAYNTDPSKPVSSAKPRLFVQVRVTEVVLQQNNQNITETLNVTFQETVTLTCVTGTSRPTPTIDWFIGSQKIASGVSLTYAFSNMDHNGTIFCQAYNTDPSRPVSSAKPRLFVRVDVTNVTLSSRNGTVVFYEGVSQSLSCASSPSRPVPTITWWLGNSQVTENITVLVTDANTLHVLTSIITLVMTRDRTNQTIYCDGSISTQVHPATSKQLIVAVWYAPDVKVNISGFAVVNSTAVLMCIAQGEPQKYTFHQWIHMVGQTEIRTLDGENTFNFSNLTLSNISIQDMGTYKCTVDNSITGLDGQINRTADTHVYVEGLPIVGKTQSTFAGETNKSISIEIQFFSYPSIKTVKFIKQLASSEISNTSDSFISPSNITMMFYMKKVTIPGHVAVLYLRNVKDIDFGNYTLQLSNDKGTVSWHFDFIVSAPPSVPKNFFFSHIDDGLLVFWIEAGFNGGHKQTFIVEYQPFGLPDAAWTTVFKINETGLDDQFPNGTYYIKIPKIQDGHYVFRVYAENEKGSSSALESKRVEIKTELPSAVIEDVPVAAVAGGVVGAFVLVIVIVAVAFIIKRRTLKPIMGGLVDNPVYDDSDSRPGTGIAVAAHTEDPSKLYAQVDKTNTNMNKAASKGKHGKTSRAASEGKHGKTSRGDIYENSTQTAKSSMENVYEDPGQSAAGPSSGDNVYENSEASVSKGKLVNKDGLLYADLKLGPPTKKAGKPVIHGLENQTEYAEIAYGKRGEPLPESDDEKESGGAKKKNGTQMNIDE